MNEENIPSTCRGRPVTNSASTEKASEFRSRIILAQAPLAVVAVLVSFNDLIPEGPKNLGCFFSFLEVLCVPVHSTTHT